MLRPAWRGSRGGLISLTFLYGPLKCHKLGRFLDGYLSLSNPPFLHFRSVLEGFSKEQIICVNRDVPRLEFEPKCHGVDDVILSLC